MVNTAKQQLVQSIAADVEKFPIIGIVNLENLPAAQLQKMRKELNAKGVKVVMSRARLLLRVLQSSKKQNIQKLGQSLGGMPALLFAKDNPFSLYALLQKSKSAAPAKPGQLSPRDIVVKAGPTSFAPGPIISELAAVGIKTKVEAGKLAVIADTVIVKEGAIISQKVAETLKRLDIKPMEIGLNVVAVWENGFVFMARDLHIDEKEFAAKLTTAAQWAMNLAIESVYTTADTIELLVQKAFREGKAVSLESSFVTADTVGEILAKSERQALALQQETNL